MGKKVLLSLGGAIPNNQHITSTTSATNFANFLWRAFGPDKETASSTFPRPFGSAVVDGFDFDIENVLAAKEDSGDLSRGYGTMITRLRSLYTTDKSKTYYISGAPQCVVPDSHLANAIETSWFDFLFVQFYNTPFCSARAYFNHNYGGTNTNISFDKWISFVKASSFNKNVKVYLGLPASSSNQLLIDPKMYLAPSEANTIIKAFQCKYPSNFGGVMVFEATYSEMNSNNGHSYADQLKGSLKGTGCATKPSRMAKRAAAPAIDLENPVFDDNNELPTGPLTGLAPNGIVVSPPGQTSAAAAGSSATSKSPSSTSAYSSSVCAVNGIFTGDTESVGGAFGVASIEDCEALCKDNKECVTIQYNGDFGQLCDLYGNTVAEGGFEPNEYGSPTYERGCFDSGSSSSSSSARPSTSSARSSSSGTALVTKSSGTGFYPSGTGSRFHPSGTGKFPTGTAPYKTGSSSGVFPSGGSGSILPSGSTGSTITSSPGSGPSGPPSGPRQSTEEVFTTEIVTTYVTTCPYTSTVTSSGHQIVETGTTTSTVVSTVTETICTKCVAPPTPVASTKEIYITEIVTSYTTTCPYTHTVTSGGSQIVKTGTTVSVVQSTITSIMVVPAGSKPTGTSSSGSGAGSGSGSNAGLPGALGHGAGNAQKQPSPEIQSAMQNAQLPAGSSIPESQSPGESPAGTSPGVGSLAPGSPAGATSPSTAIETMTVVPVPSSPSQSAVSGQSGQSGNGAPGQSGSNIPGEGQPGSSAPFPVANNGTGSAATSGVASPSQSAGISSPVQPSPSTFTGAASRVEGGLFAVFAGAVAAALVL